MNKRLFFSAANDLANAASTVRLKIKGALLEAEDLLCRRQADDSSLSPDAVMYLLLGGVTEKITELMAAHDRLCQAAGRKPPFALPLRLFDEPEPRIQHKIEQLLDGGPTCCDSPSKEQPTSRAE